MTMAETRVAGRYRVGRCLGTGGMGRVWYARDEVLRRDVAIKEIALPFGLSDDDRDEMQGRSLREARAAARLNHPNVVRIYDVMDDDERPLIIMEYVPSRSLLQVIHESGPLPVAQVAGIGLAVLSALTAANRVGVIHRDVKPSNVLVADDGRVVLTDFGSAIIDQGEGVLTRTGVILGSPRYISPERARNGIATPESDLWSLGATLYEAVEGQAPYARETTLDTLVALATQKPDPVRKAGALKPVLNGLLQKDPRARMKAGDVEERLRRIVSVQNAVGVSPVPAQRRPAQFGDVIDNEARPGEPASLPEGLSLVRPAPVEDAGPPPTPPAVAGRRRPRRRLIVTAAATGVVLAGGAVTYALDIPPWPAADGSATDGELTAAPPHVPTPAAPTSAAVVDPNVLPAGFTWYKGRSGFRVAVPAGWKKIQEGRSIATFGAPGGLPLVAVRDWTPPDPDVVTALAREETAAGLRGYRRVRIDVAGQGAVWEYAFTDPKRGPLHGLDRAVVAGGRSYVIQWRTPAAAWDQNLADLERVTTTFHPAAPRPTAGPDALPAGYTWFKSPSGFKVAAPTGYEMISKNKVSVSYCAPTGPPLFGVRLWNRSSTTDLGAALRREESLAKLANYRRISMEVLPGQQGAVWEYTFTDPRRGKLRGVERAFIAPSGKAYLLHWRTAPGAWSRHLAELGIVASSFRV